MQQILIKKHHEYTINNELLFKNVCFGPASQKNCTFALNKTA